MTGLVLASFLRAAAAGVESSFERGDFGRLNEGCDPISFAESLRSMADMAALEPKRENWTFTLERDEPIR